MNQGLYFGQMVIGPAGSGKVTFIVSSPLTAKLCKKWRRRSKEILLSLTSILQLSTTSIVVTGVTL